MSAIWIIHLLHVALTPPGTTKWSSPGRRGENCLLHVALTPCPSPGRRGESCHASSTAMIPVRKTPSKVPAPPIEATGGPKLASLSIFIRSAPMSVPKVPAI